MGYYYDRLTDEEERKIVNAYKVGLGYDDIRRIYHRSHAVVREILLRNNVPIRQKGVRISEADREVGICNQYRDGFTIKEVAKMANVSESYVHRVLKRMNVEITRPFEEEFTFYSYS